MYWVDAQRAGERSPKRFVGSDQSLQALVDLPVRPLPSLLDSEHHEQADTHADECENREPNEG
ncbi:hypothetical protein GWQ43_09490 [Alcaligenes faecalis]|nr:hypothetical protein GWQ43_09490 [Alcaligenes faecalis]